ncbi:hypothetical protein BHK98_12675 [Hornefia porci]|uniref:Regulatory protein RecX n=1 Tax=Hornefia porci TaxID=2652292 RepID=A0A1Q9JKV8_9FIRM|nr:regulatory protein RecX [Hornefia porci]OLR56843.1 hypothetical protein BHK98_12675 [Hornefia porci]
MNRSCGEAAVRKLADRMMTAAEMKSFLSGKGYEDEEIRQTILQLREDGYLDDRKYCAEYFVVAFRRNKGKYRVFAELRRKGVDEEIIAAAYEDYADEQPVDETSMAREEAEKVLRLAELTPEDPVPDKIRGRIARRLNSLGYGSGIIYAILEELKRGE